MIRFLIAALLVLSASRAFAQAGCPAGTTVACFAALPKPASPITAAGCSVGTTSAQCLAASTATSSLTIQNTSASINIACRLGGTAILNDVSSFMLAPGQARQWALNTSGVPSNALNCIAGAAATPLYVEYN
jgi:hypothetical protein